MGKNNKQANVKLNKIEIVKAKVVGKKNEDYYMLTGYAKNKNARTARWLIKNGNDFYFYGITEEFLGHENESFYSTYYCVSATDNSPTVPMVLNFGDGYKWSISENPATIPHSTYKVRKSLIYGEEFEF